MFHPEVTSRHTEMRRGEAAVKAGRQQVLLVVEERKLESDVRKSQELIRRNPGLVSSLEEIEKENQRE